MSCINVLRMTGLYRSDKTVLVTKYGSAYAVGWWRAQLHPDRDRRARETLKQVSLVAERLAPLRSECWDRPAYLRGPVTVKKWDAALDRIASSFNTSSSDRMLASHLMQNRVRLPVVDARIVRGRADYLPKCDVVGRTLDFGSYGSPVLLRGIGPESGVGSMNSTGVGSKLSDSLDSRGRTSETCYSPDRLSRSISTSTDDLGSMESISETRYSPSPSRRSIGVSTDDLPGFSPQPQMTASKAQMMQLIASRRIDPLSLRAIDDMRVSTTSVESVGTTIGSSVSSYRRSGYSLPRGMVEVRAEVYRSDSSGGRERIADAMPRSSQASAMRSPPVFRVPLPPDGPPPVLREPAIRVRVGAPPPPPPPMPAALFRTPVAPSRGMSTSEPTLHTVAHKQETVELGAPMKRGLAEMGSAELMVELSAKLAERNRIKEAKEAKRDAERAAGPSGLATRKDH